MVLPVGKSVSVGDYIACSAASGGTNPNAINGLHPVSVWVSGTRTATVEVAYKNGSETPSGAISCIIDLIKSVIAFSDKNGIKIIGPYYGGTWRGLVIQGDYDGANDAKNGIWALNGAVVSLATAPTSGYGAGVWGFQTGLYSQNNGLIFADYGFVSKAGQHLTACQNGGILSLRSSTLNACNNSGIFAYNGSTVSGNNITIVGTGNNSVFSYQGSFIDITSSFVGESDSTTSVIADRWSGIDGTGATVDDAISPVTDGNNDGSYVIGL
jgi:predicted aconitase with swiveling domain